MDTEAFFHVAVKATDIEESQAFYEQFGATVVDRGDASEGEGATAVTHVALETADKRVYLFDRAPYEAAGLVDGVDPGFLHFGYVVGDVDEAFAELTGSGAGSVMDPTTFGDLRIAFVTDPDGVRVELLEHVE